MIIVSIQSKNPIKLEAVEKGFGEFFFDRIPENMHFRSVKGSGGAPVQPMTPAEALRGSIHRAVESAKGSDYGVGLEGGIFKIDDRWFCNGWVAVHRKGVTGIGQCPGVMVPSGIMRMVLEEGMELGDAEDVYFGTLNTKQGLGLTGIMSAGLVTRRDSFAIAVGIALGGMSYVGQENNR